MTSFHDLTTAQFRQALQLREQISSLQEKLDAVLGGATSGPANGKRVVSAATKKKMAAAQQARYAKLKTTTAKTPVTREKGGLTPEGKAKIAAAMKARWAAKRAAVAE